LDGVQAVCGKGLIVSDRKRSRHIQDFWGRTLRPALVVCGAVLAVVAAASCSAPTSAEAPKKGEPRVVPVSVAAATLKTIPIELRTFGTVETAASVTVRLEITGLLTHVHFQKGQDVQKGDLMFTIDQRPYDAALKQAEAVLAKDKIMAKNVVAEAERQKALVEKGILSPSEYEKSQADADALAANVQADEAAIDTAKFNLEQCFIKAPISGRVGNLLVTEGNIVKLTDMPMAVINQISPIEVFFSISQDELALLRRHADQGKMAVAVTLPNDPGKAERGELTFIDNTLDKTTGTVQVAGLFENKERRLWPGQYVAVVLAVGEIKDAVTVPSQAIQNGRDSKYVFVIRPDGTAEMRPVTVGLVYGGDTIVEKGLAAAEVVVTDGHIRLKAGDRAEIKPAVKAPSTALAEKAAPEKAAPEKAAPEKAPAEKASPGGGA
jgi:multidrug efflux system membrane fusion protein